MPKLSIIMPVFNTEKYLREAIDSIIQQSFTDWELLIINDGSTDSSENIIQSYTDKRIQYHRNDQNIGLISTLNKGIDICTGDYIARMDADDISEKDRFKIQLAFLAENKEYAMCGSYAKVIDENNNETGKILNLQTNDFLQINLLFSVPFIHPSMMFRREVLKNNYFDPKYKHAEDYELWCRIANNYKIANIPDYLLRYRWHTNNVSVTYSQIQENIKNKIICKELQNIGLQPSEKELYLHKITFQQFDSKTEVVKQKFEDYSQLDSWFWKIIDSNKNKQKYNEASLIAFLWSRWIVLCISQKKYNQIWKPKFASYNLSVLYRTFNLLIFLKKKI
ncbi:glycosyltransferase [Dysgonomonas sp. HDW5B]|uniref:glycosyltransferase family 2 protein n=1 Tax=Dysgonomonas sp. HDW5B TaxID=2714927 RepID=UPI001408D16E|nr:glycosyltransferase [Dysgonomonas sp. HDW5B]QIK54208.1 glycosyltransferase [Dysgonomonas sp. HDW5B]